METCFHFNKDKRYFRDGPGLRTFFLGYPIIRLKVEDEHGEPVNWDWYPSEYLYLEPEVNDYCIAGMS